MRCNRSARRSRSPPAGHCRWSRSTFSTTFRACSPRCKESHARRSLRSAAPGRRLQRRPDLQHADGRSGRSLHPRLARPRSRRRPRRARILRSGVQLAPDLLGALHHRPGGDRDRAGRLPEQPPRQLSRPGLPAARLPLPAARAPRRQLHADRAGRTVAHPPFRPRRRRFLPAAARRRRRLGVPLLDRLILREILVPLGVGILAILQLLVILQLLQLNEIVFGSAVTLVDLGRLTLALAPHFLVVAVPLAFMLGVQLGIGRLANDRELIALSAAGVHPLRLYRVPIALACVLAIAVTALTRQAEPWGLRELNRVLNDVIKRNVQSGLTPGVFNDGLPRFMVYVGAQKGSNWKGVLIEDDVGDGAPLLAVAEAGHIEDAGGDALALRLVKGEIHRSEPHGETVARFEEGSFLVGVQEPM